MSDTYLDIDVDKFNNSHAFMAEEVLTPWCNHTDSIRLNMFTGHITQAVALTKPEFPRVFTGFENQVGKFSSAKKTTDRKLLLYKTIKKHSRLTVHILIDEKANKVMIVEAPVAKGIAEGFGYNVKDRIKKYKEGETIPKNSILQCSAEWDSRENFAYGTNLKAIFAPLYGLTYEDAVIISKSAARKLDSVVVQEHKVSLNTNDILVNIYGNSENYKPFPDIGEQVQNKILCSRRRLEYKTIFHDFASDRIDKINFATDDSFYTDDDSEVIDIEIFSNTTIENLEKYDFNITIINRLKKNLEFYKKIKEALQELKNNGFTLDDDAGFFLQRANQMLLPEYKFIDESRNDFDNLIIKFKIRTISHLVEGSKITGRYGNKGTIAAILPDDQMPYTEDGERVDVVLNVLGVVGRLNPGQLFEQEVNFCANQLVKRMKTMDSAKDQFKLYWKFIKSLVPKEFTSKIYKKVAALSDDELKKFMNDIITNGIFVMIPPFYNCPNFFTVSNIYKGYEIDPVKICIPSKDGPIVPERKLIVGDMYFIRLKHDAEGKFSARSAGALSLASIPSKNNRAYKDGKAPYAKTAVRIGGYRRV